MHKSLVIIFVLLLAGAGGIFWYTQQERPGEPSDTPSEIDTSTWQEFTNTQYDFSLKYPADDWEEHADTEQPFTTKFNFYQKPAGVTLDLPLDHFANVNHVSVYPQGIPTEGVFGETRDFDLAVPFAVTDDSRIYTLANGTPFAAYIKPKEPPRSWNESGFIWVRLKIDNLETQCVRDGSEISRDECDPLVQGDRVIRAGVVDTTFWQQAQALLNTISFAEGSLRKDIITLDSPTDGATVTSPLRITGQARGQWYFEATFPVVLTDWDGRIIAEGFAEAQDEWMTTDFVPFVATLEFESPYSEGDPDFMRRGSLILQKANPSGLPEHADAHEIVVQFGG